MYDGDIITIGHYLLQVEGSRLVEFVDTGDISFEAEDLAVFAGTKQLMHEVSFQLPARSLLAVVGPSGAGKSTLLNALTGFRPADSGTVWYAGRDLYASYDELRRRIGYVPQEDLLHTTLSVRKALEFGAQLRFPPDVTEAERTARVDEVLAELGLTQHANTQVARLSGGQRKRTSVALELLTKPSLLYLDEPTSGLDPGLDKSVMQSLRTLADDGRTVVVVTHSVANLDVCDFVLMLAPGGYVAYFGPPSGALAYFGKTDFADVFLALEATPGPEWDERFRASKLYRASAGGPPGRTGEGRAPRHPPAVRSVEQLATLTRRYLVGRALGQVVHPTDHRVPVAARRHPARGSGQERVARPVQPTESGCADGPAGADLVCLLHGHGQLGARDRQGTADLPAGAFHRPVDDGLSRFEDRRTDASSPPCRLSCSP